MIKSNLFATVLNMLFRIIIMIKQHQLLAHFLRIEMQLTLRDSFQIQNTLTKWYNRLMILFKDKGNNFEWVDTLYK